MVVYHLGGRLGMIVIVGMVGWNFGPRQSASDGVVVPGFFYSTTGCFVRRWLGRVGRLRKKTEP